MRRSKLPSALRAATLIAIIAGAIAMLSYATAAPRYIRTENSQLGAWLEASQFQIMEAGATAFGLLLGMQIAAGLANAGQYHARATMLAACVAIAAFLPLMRICAAAARFGWNANSAAVAGWITGYRGYETGMALDKVLIAGVYFLKTTAFAALAGMALAAFATTLPGAHGSARKSISPDPQDT